MPIAQRWNEMDLRLEDRCVICGAWKPKYEKYPIPGMCPKRQEHPERKRKYRKPLFDLMLP